MDTKHCSKCKQIKPVSEFSERKLKTKVIHQAYCKVCNSEHCRKLYKEGARKAQTMQRNTEQRKRLLNFLAEHKLDVGCSKCGYKANSAALEFHHLRDKEKDVSTLANRGVSLKRLKKEIDKCIVLCANCHRELHNQ